MSPPTSTSDSHHPSALPSSQSPPVQPGRNEADAPHKRSADSASMEGLAFVMDVPVEVTVEVGRRKMKIAEVLRLGAGSVLELDSAAGDPLNVYVNNRLIARGEAVVVGDRYGVRLVEVLAGEHRGRVGASP
jgi:flagellar motor switch protein FliN/FliY